MRIGKLWLSAILAAIPAAAAAQPGISVNVGVDVGDSYDTVAPGDPVENVDVFYDQLSPYGVWVDEPDVGRVFIPSEAAYQPYRVGHWQYTSVGFVWVSSEPHAWATTHYGRWAYSNSYARWYWLPDTEWGPAWVEWRQTGSDFGWAPLPPEVVVRAGWQPPVDNWHYCPAERVLDVNVTRYYEPRERVVVIHRDARPIEHYSTISRVKVVVGPPAATLREHRVAVRPVKIEARTVGRWTPTEAHAQVQRAQEHRATFEAENQKRLDANVKIREAHAKVIETHPAIKAQINARATVRAGEPAPGARPEPGRPEPGRVETKPAPGVRPEPGRPEPGRADPKHPEPAPAHSPPIRAEPKQPEPRPTPGRPEPKQPEPPRGDRPGTGRVEPKAPESRPAPTPKQPEPPRGERPGTGRVEPKPPEPRPTPTPTPKQPEPPRGERPGTGRVEPKQPEPRPMPTPRPEPKQPEPRPTPTPTPAPRPERPEQVRPATPANPEPKRVEPGPAKAEPVQHAPADRGGHEPPKHDEKHDDKH